MTERDILWQHEEPISSYPDAPDVPPYIDGDISPSDVAAIVQGGCVSGAYMPAVTYWQALETMHQHGDRVFDDLAEHLGEGHFHPAQRPGVTNGTIDSWAGLACYYVSAAVELWAASVEDELADLLEELDDEAAE